MNASKKRVKVAVFPVHSDALEPLNKIASVELWNHRRQPDERELAEFVGNADAVICTGAVSIGAHLLAECPQLSIVALASVGYDKVDTEACRRSGVAVTNCRGALHEATADLTWALILAARRRIVEADRFVRDGLWRSADFDLMLGSDVHASTLGIVGYGQIGHAVARRGVGFNMRVVHHSRGEKSDEISEWMTLEALLGTADVITLHVPLTPETQGLIGEKELKLMKPSAVLINTARAGVVDQPALIAALQERRIAAAALDVSNVEPNSNVADPLFNLSNCIVLPHIGSASTEARRSMVALAVANIVAALGSQPLLTPVW